MGWVLDVIGEVFSKNVEVGVVVLIDWDFVVGKFLIVWIGYFQFVGQVDLQLEVLYVAVCLFGDFGMYYVMICSYLLEVIVFDDIGMFFVVVVMYFVFDYDGDCFKVLVWMFWEFGDIVISIVGVEIVQYQEGVELYQVLMFQYLGQFDVGVV